jgi:hypothetical protein
MRNNKPDSEETLVHALWNAIFSGTRLKRVGDEDRRTFILKAILWQSQESKVVDVNTCEVFRFPWTELEFLDPPDGNLPGLPLASKNL